jgi:hypothetical protein
VEGTEFYNEILQKKKAVLSAPFMIPPRPGSNDVDHLTELWCDFYKDYIPENKNCYEPMSTWGYPIIDTLDKIKSDVNSDAKIHDIKGVLLADVHFKSLINDILPIGSNGLIVVFENVCSENSFTYQIDGPEVTCIGGGDLHDPEYNSLQVSSGLFNLKSFQIENSTYSGLELESDSCAYSLYAYPSDEMRSSKCIELTKHLIQFHQT